MVSSDFSRRDALILFLAAFLLRVVALSPGPIQPQESAHLDRADLPAAASPGSADLTATLVAALRPLAPGASDPDGGLGGLRLVFLLLGSLAAPALGAAGGRLGGRTTGWIAGGLAAVGPFAFKSSLLVGPAGLVITATAGSLWLLTILAEKATPGCSLGAGALTGLAVAANPGAAGLALAWPAAARGTSWILAIPAAVAMFALGAPATLVAIVDPTTPTTAAGSAGPASPLASGLWTLVGIAGFGPSVLAAFGIASSARRGLAGDRALLVATGGAFVVSLLTGGGDPSRLAVVLPGVLLLAALGISGPTPWSRTLPRAAQGVVVALILAEALLGTAPKIAGRWLASPPEKARVWIEQNVTPGSPILVEGDVRLAAREDAHPRSSAAEETSPIYQPIELPARGSSGQESTLFYDPNVAQLFSWILLEDRPEELEAAVVRARFREWLSEQWDTVGQFDSVDPDAGSYTIFRRPSDFRYDPESVVSMVEHLGAPRLNAVRDTSQAFTRWIRRCGTAFRAIGEARTARGLLGLAKTRDPSDPQVNFELGLVHILLGQDEDAKRTLLEGLDVDPYHGGMHYNLGTLLEKEGSTDGAEVEYRAAILQLDDPTPAHARLGALLVARGDLEGASVQLAELLARDPQGEATLFLAEIMADAQSAP
jgi:tetratricopeptide (TPR) repeat protein